MAGGGQRRAAHTLSTMPDEEKKEKKRKESKHKTNKFVAVWQDREIRFDTPTAHLQNRKGEAVIDSINSVEDTKGNNGERGSLVGVGPDNPCTRLPLQPAVTPSPEDAQERGP